MDKHLILYIIKISKAWKYIKTKIISL